MTVSSARRMNEVDRTDRVALRHPGFWLATLLLVLNDHWLKGADLLPGWLTGKLSDVAGLIVAPIALSALFAVRTRRGRGLAFVTVSAWFVAANLVPAISEATTTLGAWVGLEWHFWPDPTDLVTLAVLPLGWHIASYREERPRGRTSTRVLLGFALAACLASPTPEPQWTATAFLVNRTDRTLEVQVRWVEVSVDCAAVSGHVEDMLTSDSFESGTRFIVEPDETLPLDRGTALGDPGDPFADAGMPTTRHLGSCEIAMIRTEGLPDVIVFWDGLVATTIPVLVAGAADEVAVANGLSIAPVADSETALQLIGAPGYQVERPLDLYAGGSRCEEYGAVSGFAWTDIPATWEGRVVRLLRVEPTVDDCVAVTMQHGAESHDVFICVPPSDFPFLPNSEVTLVHANEHELHMVRDLPVDGLGFWRTGELRVVRGVERFEEGPFNVGLELLADDCRGVRMDCGGFRVPAAGGIRLTDGTRYVHPGEAIERTAEDGRRARLRVGRAETMLVTHPACGAGRDELGARLEALVMYGEEPR